MSDTKDEKSRAKRIALSTFALAFNKLLNILFVFISIPIMLHTWGTQTYGEWLLIAAFPQQFAILANLGLASHASNRIATKIGGGSSTQARALFQNAHLAVTTLSACVGCAIALALQVIDLPELLNINILSEEFMALMLLALSTMFAKQQAGIFLGALRANGQYHHATHLLSIENGGSIIFGVVLGIGILGWSPLAYGIFLLSLTSATTFVAIIYAQTRTDFAQAGLSTFSPKLFFRLIRESVGYTLLPFIETSSNQLLNLAIGASAGPNSVTHFSTLRTLAGSTRQISSIVINAFEPEMAKSLGENGIREIALLHRKLLALTVIASTSIAILLLGAAPTLYRFWTDEKLTFEPATFALLVSASLFQTIWLASGRVLIIKSKFLSMGIPYGALTILLASWAFISKQDELWRLGLALFTTHLILSWLVLSLATKLSGDTIRNMACSTHARFVSLLRYN
ncbi:MAG: hypothetical protein NXI22_00025 [bacterium]|nr:hypothetical protein [bacterium]